MIIKKVKLAPFGVISDREFALEEGLNVLLGPNEAGKSTLINSIFAALFIPSAVKKNTEDWRGFLQYYLPHPDGDTIRVELDLLAEDGSRAKYLCAWGEGGEERLILANGSEINNAASIHEHISELLQFGRGTYQSILFARQEEMNKTIDLLRENREAGETVSGFLRAAVFESGGVSLEKFEAAAEREYARLLNNWDWDADGPRGGRGIDNQHKKMVGDILRAYYDLESLRRSLRNIRSTEERISELNKQLDAAELEQKELEERLGKYEVLENDARKRSTLEPKLDAIYKEEKQVKEVADQWPRVQERVANTEKDIQVKQQAKVKLEESLKEAQAELVNRQTRKLFDQVEPLKKDLEKKQAELKALKQVSGEDVSTLEDYLRQEDNLKGIAGAMKLKAVLTVKKPLSVKVTSGLEEPRRQNIENEELLYGDGRLLLETEDWAIDIQSGQQDVSKLLSDAKTYRDKFNALLAKLEVEDLEAAKEAAATRAELEGSIKAIENK
ncbi:MAG: AAA family ATPase, partial [Bacillota bacterium]